ncbi:putative non-specific serine/threonine protein kinase [Dioscorea sansibarensis]
MYHRLYRLDIYLWRSQRGHARTHARTEREREMRPRAAAAKLSLFLFLSLLIWSFFAILHCHGQPLPQSEVAALKTIGVKLRKKWNFTVDPCSGNSGWVDPNSDKDVAVNVTCGACDTTSCHITSILLKSQNLNGTLPDEFSKLTYLGVIDLSRNYLNGTIPVAWASLPLTTLSLLGNRISGNIPEELSGVTTLQELVLEDNQMEGPILQSLSNLTNLERLRNNFSSELPKSLSNLTNLTDLIDGNPISGKVPAFIGNWKKLDKLYMQGTSLEGPFPSNFSALEALTELMVSSLIGGDGKFPPLGNMTAMKRLILRNISLSGELPAYITKMTQLKTLDLSFNNLTGKIPDTFSSLKHSLELLFLTNNKLTGEIPGWILNNNKKYDLSYNNFDSSNAPPDCYSNGVNLVSSYSTSSNNKIPTCFRKNYPCSGRAESGYIYS